ncbi:hypothetical protein [Paenibacillus sp. B1-33]|uniref:hypothetical protein n=1 Tax=unclassified Paenibacillus TaxID=185978 RepID=UPI003D2CBA39
MGDSRNQAINGNRRAQTGHSRPEGGVSHRAYSRRYRRTITVDFYDGIGEVTFTRSIRIVPDTSHNAKFSAKGDSGVVIITEQNQVVGLLFAGTDDESVTIANNISEVVQSLGITGFGGGGDGGAH